MLPTARVLNEIVRRTLAFRAPSAVHWHAPEHNGLLQQSGVKAQSQLQLNEALVEADGCLRLPRETYEVAVIQPNMGAEEVCRSVRCPASLFQCVVGEAGALSTASLADVLACASKYVVGAGAPTSSLCAAMDERTANVTVHGTLMCEGAEYTVAASAPSAANALYLYCTPQGTFLGSATSVTTSAGTREVVFAAPDVFKEHKATAAERVTCPERRVGPTWLPPSGLAMCAVVTVPLLPPAASCGMQRDVDKPLHIQLRARACVRFPDGCHQIKWNPIVADATLKLVTELEDMLLTGVSYSGPPTEKAAVVEAVKAVAAAAEAGAGAGDAAPEEPAPAASASSQVLFCDAPGCKAAIPIAGPRFSCLKCAGTEYCAAHRAVGLAAHEQCGQFARVEPQASGSSQIYVRLERGHVPVADMANMAARIDPAAVPEGSTRNRLARAIVTALQGATPWTVSTTLRLGVFLITVEIVDA